MPVLLLLGHIELAQFCIRFVLDETLKPETRCELWVISNISIL